MKIEKIKLTKRKKPKESLCRFWMPYGLWNKFSKKSKKEGYIMRDILEDFVKWYLKKPR